MKKITRREFISTTGKLLAVAPLAGALGSLPACSDSKTPPNILLIMVDQMQTPPEGYGTNEGAAQGLKEILGFQPLSDDNAYTQYFPGLLRLRQNAVICRKHYTASSACVPSRTCIMTGQYSSVTGVDQTDGNYKSATDVPFLDPKGIPTIGDWFRAAGYTTHYFGKWHVSEADADTNYLEDWGFSDWEKSYPEPHGGSADNLGVYRDVLFAENVVEFLKGKAADTSGIPWLAVSSFVNPHDCGYWPFHWQAPQNAGVVPWINYPPPPASVPAKGDTSLPATYTAYDNTSTTFTVDLNPDGFPQNNSTLPPTFIESLDGKPRCQKDYSLKWGLSLESNSDYMLEQVSLSSPHPFQLQGDYAKAWSLSYHQFYFYCQYLADLRIRSVLQALDDNKLSDNTIVVFLSDHGEMGGAHGGMIQKWHNAYEEIVRVPMVISSPLVNKNKDEMREILQPTSSIDLAPTLLGLAGYNEREVRATMEADESTAAVQPLAGADLSAHIKGACRGAIHGPDGKPRTGVFFMTNDMITELGANETDTIKEEYQAFLTNVDTRISRGVDLASGTVRQPNNVRALFTGDWKIVHYVDPNGVEADEWELYCLKTDPIEQTNLVDFSTGEILDNVSVRGMTTAALKLKNKQLKKELAGQEAAVIGTSS